MQETNVTNLKVLHCNYDESWLYQASTSALEELNRQLMQRFDWVIYDSGTLQEQLTSNLLQVVGKVLYVGSVTEANGCQEEIIEQIEHCGALSLGFVENTPLVTTQAY